MELFPVDINRDYFGAWLSGFVDGEGCFMLSIVKQIGRYIPKASFHIGLRGDDLYILQLIQSYLMCGEITRTDTKAGTSQVRLLVRKVSNLWENIVPHFDKFPLLAKKKNDFAIWRNGVELMYEVISVPMVNRRFGLGQGRMPRWTGQDLEKFYNLKNSLSLQRAYKEQM